MHVAVVVRVGSEVAGWWMGRPELIGEQLILFALKATGEFGESHHAPSAQTSCQLFCPTGGKGAQVCHHQYGSSHAAMFIAQ